MVSVAPEPESGFGLAVQRWTGMREVEGSRLDRVTIFGVRSVGSYAHQRWWPRVVPHIVDSMADGVACLTWGLVGK